MKIRFRFCNRTNYSCCWFDDDEDALAYDDLNEDIYLKTKADRMMEMTMTTTMMNHQTIDDEDDEE
jgi:hypothetical protein